MTAPVSIIIPAFNQVAYCEQCLTALARNTPQPHQLILVDNGSTDGVGELFDSVAGARVIHAEQNLGFAGGVNLGLRVAEGHAVLLNSDALVAEGWLERMLDVLQRDAAVGLVGPMSNCVSGPQQIDGLDFESLDAIDAYARAHSAQYDRQSFLTERLVAFCLLIRDEVLAQVGLFDERFGIGNFEDDDYGRRTREAGYRLCVAEDAFVFHYGSRTFSGMGLTGSRWQSLMDENQQKYQEKWQGSASAEQEALAASQRLNTTAREMLRAGNPKMALGLLKQAIEACPGLETNYNDLGVLLWAMEQREDAYGYVERAVRMKPGYQEARDNLRDMAEALGVGDRARALLERSGEP